MGCVESKEDTEGPVGRCRERKHLLRAAVAARHALAAAHVGHAAALKNVGAALSDYASGEAHDGLLRAASAAAAVSSGGSVAMAQALPPPPPRVEDVLPPPPPPPPGEVPPTGPLVRSMSAPDLPLPGIKKKPSGDAAAAIIEEDDAEGGDGDGDGEAGVDASVTTQRRDEENHPPPPPPPPTRSPPRLPPETEPKVPQGTSWDEFIFGSQDTTPPPTLEPDAPEPSWAAEKREAAAQPQPQPQPTPVEEVAETKKVEDASDIKKVEEAGERRAATQKAARKAEGKKGRLVVVAPAATNLLKILHQLDDHFLKASQSAHEVSKILEAARLHYHSNFAETRGFVDHSARVMQVITWNRSFKGIPQPENVKNELYDDEWETHATVLDKLLAWEKKLYHEVKDFEVIKLEYQQKLAVLNRKKQRGASSASLEKTKSVVSHLHTKYVVDVQTMESTVAEINQLRDEQLYPKLFELVRGMEKMWDAMHINHREQLRIISELKSFDISVAIRETSEQHHERTMQLLDIVRKWHSLFNNFMMSQKEYIENLYHWLKLNVIPIETNLKGKPNSSQPPHETVPPIKRLLHAWHDKLGKLPHEAAKNAIFRFSEVVWTIVLHQEDELKLRVKCEEMRRDLERKKRQFEDWAQKYMKKRAGILPEDNNANGDPLVERRAAVESLNHALKEEEENCRVKCRVVREKSINILRTSLPELFRVVSDFSGQSAAMFRSLRSIAHSNDQLQE